MSKNGVTYEALYKLVDDRTNIIMKKFDNLEERVTSLEKWQDRAKYTMGVVAAGFGIVTGLVNDWMKKKLGWP